MSLASWYLNCYGLVYKLDQAIDRFNIICFRQVASLTTGFILKLGGSMSEIEKIKEKAKDTWAGFIPFENLTGTAAPELIRFSKIRENDFILDVACGTGVVALTAARMGTTAVGSDITPALVKRANENAKLRDLNIDFVEADAEDLPFEDKKFDAVVSQFGHMFAPRPEIALSEMLRVLKPGGTIAFSTWPPELFMGNFFKIIAKNNPKPPEGVPSPILWGDVNIVTQRLSPFVTDLHFDRGRVLAPALTPHHFLRMMEKNAGPLSDLITRLSQDPKRLEDLRSDLLSLIDIYFYNNFVKQDFLITRAKKK